MDNGIDSSAPFYLKVYFTFSCNSCSVTV